MKIAYADPPYLGCCSLYGHQHTPEWDNLCWNTMSAHRKLLDYLYINFPDGWGLSVSTPSLREILPFCTADVRVAAWVKPFAVFKPNVNPAYAWEPVIWRGGRASRSRDEPTVRDWVSIPITLQKGLPGAKPEAFCFWLFGLLGLQDGDSLTDLFPGTGVVGRTWEQYRRQRSLFSATDQPVGDLRVLPTSEEPQSA